MSAEAILLCDESDLTAESSSGKIVKFNAKGEPNINLLESGISDTTTRSLTDLASVNNSTVKVAAKQAYSKSAPNFSSSQPKKSKANQRLSIQSEPPRDADSSLSSAKELTLTDKALVQQLANTSITTAGALQDNQNIDVNGEILGAQLGWEKRQIIALLGEPSAIVRVSGKQSAFFYGRKHLFLFDRDILVGYEHSDWLLPLHLSNRIPLHDKLYQAGITIDKELEIGSTLSQVSQALYLKAPILRYNTLRVQGRKTLTRLYFNNNSLANNLNEKQLSGISIYFRGYQEFDWQSVVALSKSKTFIDLSEGLLDSKSKISKEDVVETLGLPTLTIAKPRNKDIWIYGNSLIVDFVRGNMIKYTLESSKHQSQHRPCTQCLYVGQPRTEIPNQFVTQRTQRQLTLESKGFSYLVSLSEDSIPKVDDVQAFIKR